MTDRGTQSRSLISLGQDLAHARELVASEPLERLDGEIAQPLAFLGRQFGQQLADLAGELDAHFVVGVVRKQPVGMCRRGWIGGDSPASRLIAFIGQEEKNFGRGIGAFGERFARGLVMRFEDFQHRLAAQLRRKQISANPFDPPPPCNNPGPAKRIPAKRIFACPVSATYH